MHHAWYTLFTLELQGMPSPAVWSLTSQFAYGRFAVSAFIVISGFSLSIPVARGNGHLKGGAFAFFMRRAKRILPPYYLAIVFSLLLIWLFIGQKTGTHWDMSIPVTGQDILTHALLIQNFVVATEFKINHAMWSIAVEWQIYFLFPLLVLLSRHLSALLVAALVCIGAFFAIEALPGELSSHLSYPVIYSIQLLIDYLGLFAVGMLGATIAFASHRVFAALRRYVPWTLLAVGGLTAVYILARHNGEELFIPPFPELDKMDLLVGASTTALLLAAVRPGRTLVGAILGWKPLAKVGTFSYSLYLIHAPLLQLIYLRGIAPLHLSRLFSLGMLVALGIPLIVGSAYLFFLVCERPFLNLPAPVKQAEVSAPTPPALSS
jgi:peptidoglycan/LPS O-acetylase OafA/YrhL